MYNDGKFFGEILGNQAGRKIGGFSLIEIMVVVGF